MTHVQASCSTPWRSAWTQHLAFQRSLPTSTQHFKSGHLFQQKLFFLDIAFSWFETKNGANDYYVIKEYYVLKCDAVCFGWYVPMCWSNMFNKLRSITSHNTLLAIFSSVTAWDLSATTRASLGFDLTCFWIRRTHTLLKYRNDSSLSRR
jgi:hypothetical protein